ncbi:sensor histidine kinase [Gracilimonas halophila]|uniref:ATP-binding protein n=1 Tax=Gracilimonas halophila TaxID=1834464 RepID=A0ABW5JKZ9_9BACT
MAGQGFSFHFYYPPEEYGGHVQNWTAEQDTNGFIYFGNGDGLLIFDGIDWKNIHIGETGRGTSIYSSTDGRVYVSGQSDFGFIKPDSVNNIEYHSLSKEYGKRALPQFETHEWNNAIYFRHLDGINKYDDDELRSFPIPDDTLFGYSVIAGDSLILGSRKGMVSFNQKEVFKRIKGSSFLKGDVIYVAFQKDEKEYLFGSSQNLLFTYDGNTFQKFETKADQYLQENQIYDGIKIHEDLFAFATLYGGVVFIDGEGEMVKIFNENTGLANNMVYDLYLDKEKNLWIGLQKGIQKLLITDNLIHYGEHSGLNDVVLNISFSENYTWVHTIFGLFVSRYLEQEKVILFDPVDFEPSITSLITWRNRSYILAEDGLYQTSDNQIGDRILDFPHMVQVEEAGDDQLQFLTPERIIAYKGATVSTSPVNIDINFSQAMRWKEELYIRNKSNGLYKVLKERIVQFPVENDQDLGISFFNTMGIIENSLFVGTEGEGENGGLYVLQEENNRLSRNHLFDKNTNLNGRQVMSFSQCSESQIWFYANKKIIKLVKIEGVWTPDDSSFGLIKNESTSDTIEGIKCMGDSVWFWGTKGIFYLKNPDFTYNSKFKSNITSVFIDRDSLVFGGYGKPKSELIFPYKDNELRFTYAAASYIDPDRNRCQVKLEGFDQNWSNWTSETQKDYTNIPEGEYSFLIRSKNVYDVEGSTASISFSILPPWYRTWWAYLLYTVTIAGILYTAYKIRVNQLLRVERIRNDIAIDLHDEVSATLSSISYFAEAIQSDKVKKDKDRFVKLIANSAGDAKEKITDIVWAINPEHDDWQAFLSKCRRYASDLLESKGIKYSLKIDEYIPGKLDMQLRQHLWLIFKEMVTNAARHSDAKQLDVIMNYEDGVLKLVVQDDGKGMNIDKVKKGNGLVNIQKRVDLIEGEITLKTSEGFGTRWILKVSV